MDLAEAAVDSVGRAAVAIAGQVDDGDVAAVDGARVDRAAALRAAAETAKPERKDSMEKPGIEPGFSYSAMKLVL